MPAVKELAGYLSRDAKHLDGAILIPWAGGQSMAWDVTVPDIFVESYLRSTSADQEVVAAKQPADNETKTY